MASQIVEPEYIKRLEDIERWQRGKFKTGKVSAVVDFVFYPVDKLVDIAIPDSVFERAIKPITGTLRMLQNSSLVFVDTDEIAQRASNAGLPVEKREDFKDIPIDYLDVLANSYFEKNATYTALQGAGLGAGGYALMAVDLPMLFTVNLKMILQIGACYGYDPTSIEEEEFALRVFCIVSSESAERDNEMRKMDELIVQFIKGTFSYELGIMATEETIQGFLNLNMRRLVRKGLTRKLIPVVGMAIGGGFNYLFTKETATYAYMFYNS